MDQSTITKRQKQVLDYVSKHIENRGYAPSLEEIAKKFKLASPSTAHFHISKLQAAGLLAKTEHRSRSLVVYEEQVPLESVAKGRSGRPTKNKSLPLNQIILGDAVQEMKKLPSESCDIVIIDPPYNIGKDFGNNQDKRELSEYISWSKQWLDEAVRLLNPSGTLFIYGFSEILAHLSVELPLNKRWLIWHYTNKNVASLNFWQRSHEAIICAWKDKPVFNRDAVREPYTESFLQGSAGKVRRGTVGRFSKGGKETVYNAHAGGALPRDVIKIPALAGGAGMVERWFLCQTCQDAFEPRQLKQHLSHKVTKHPTQKPLELGRRLIGSAAPAGGGLVLVPFAGTGSECVAAKQLGCDYIGFEMNPDYIKISEKFLANITPAQVKLV